METETKQTNDVNISSVSTTIMINQVLEFDLSLEQENKIPDTIYKLYYQIIFYKDEKNNKFELDTIDQVEGIIINNNKELKYSYKDENCPYNLFLKFQKSLGIDIDELIDDKFEKWVIENKENGYFNSLLINLKNTL